MEAEENLTYAKNSIAAAGIRCTAKLSDQGLEPGEDLVQFAEENSIDLIILGIQKLSKVGRLPFGSNIHGVRQLIANNPLMQKKMEIILSACSESLRSTAGRD